jgi:hypothetical protein
MHWFDMDMEVTDERGNIVYAKNNLLGNDGHVLLPNNFAASPHAIFKNELSTATGKYKAYIKIYDRIGKGYASQIAYFTII